jgi:lysophospholipase L1-like esterase
MLCRKKLSWPKLFVLALTILIAAIALGSWSLRSRYESRLRWQIWPVNVPEISIATNSAGGSARTVLLLGDSRMLQWGMPKLTHWRVVNAGTGGLTTGQILLCAPKLLDEFHPAAVVLEAGINDLKILGLRPELASVVVSLAADNLSDIVGECTRRHCKIIVLETWPVGQPGLMRQLVWSGMIPVSVNQLNTRLRTLNSPEQGIRVIDLFNEAGLKPGIELYRDTLHFTPDAYQRLTPALERALDSLPGSVK